MKRTQRIGIGILAMALSGLVVDRLVIGYDTAPIGDEGSNQVDGSEIRVDALLALLGESGSNAGNLTARLDELASGQDASLLDRDVFAMPMAWTVPIIPEPDGGDAGAIRSAPAAAMNLNLSSVMLGRRPMARFGNELRFVGDEIAGMVIVRIDEDGVELANGGSRYRVPVGESRLVALADDDH